MVDRVRARFVAAVALFTGWVICLGAMALLSSDRPQTRPPSRVDR